MLYLFQILIIFGVLAANIHWELTPNPIIPAVAGVALAYVLTCAVTGNLIWPPAPLFGRRRVPQEGKTGSSGPGRIGVPGETSEALEQWPRPWIGYDPR